MRRYAPGAAGAYVVESIIHNQKKMIPCSVYLEGEYGESDICIGVPVILGDVYKRQGVHFPQVFAAQRGA